MSYQFKLKKADAPTQLTGFDKRPNWKELASKIANLFHISSPDNVGIAFVDKRTVETINDEDDLREFYSQHPYDTDVKFVVQDLQAPDRECAFRCLICLSCRCLIFFSPVLLIALITFAFFQLQSRQHGPRTPTCLIYPRVVSNEVVMPSILSC